MNFGQMNGGKNEIFNNWSNSKLIDKGKAKMKQAV